MIVTYTTSWYFCVIVWSPCVFDVLLKYNLIQVPKIEYLKLNGKLLDYIMVKNLIL